MTDDNNIGREVVDTALNDLLECGFTPRPLRLGERESGFEPVLAPDGPRCAAAAAADGVSISVRKNPCREWQDYSLGLAPVEMEE